MNQPADRITMPTEPDQRISINSWLEEELYQQYVNNRAGVDESWKQVFDSEAATAAAEAQALELRDNSGTA
jgi:hypothetical protein